MKDTLKMQEIPPIVGIKKLIDCYNENYTKKKEYICKDLKPAGMLSQDEYDIFMNDVGLMFPQEIRYYPLFKISKIKDNRPTFISYILKINDKEYKGSMTQTVINGHKIVGYSNPFVRIVINGDEVALSANNMSVNVNNYSLTLYIDSPELPKLEYPKNKMDMYRAYNFISTVADYTDDGDLGDYMEYIELPYPNNIDEINLYFDEIWNCDDFNLRNNAYFINFDKDNYYTILDAIKKGETIYKDLDTPLVNWEINKEEKVIYLGKLTVTETGLQLSPE